MSEISDTEASRLCAPFTVDGSTLRIVKVAVRAARAAALAEAVDAIDDLDARGDEASGIAAAGRAVERLTAGEPDPDPDG